MKKKLQNLFKSNLPKNTTCAVHFESQLPHLRPLEYCNSCKISFCYTCGNKHFDKYCNVEWGLEIFTFLEPPKNEKNERFNMGYPFGVDITKLNCPCGTSFLSKSSSSICSACGTATCSAECHDKYAQKDGKCLFINNFTPNEETTAIQGLRLIKVTDFINAMKVDMPVFSPTSLSNSKFMKALTSPFPFYFILQRGFRQYGQPHLATLDSIEEFQYEKDGISSKNMFEKFSSRLCMCECKECTNKSPHPIYNCYDICEENEKLTEQDKLTLQIYQKCKCTCSYCLTNKASHTTDECMRYCQLNSYKRF